MHSTIFDSEGPSTKSIYAPNQQHVLHGALNSSLRHNNQTPPVLDMPSAADIRCTHNVGSNAVNPANAASARGGGGYSPERPPRTTTSGHLVADGEAIPVVSAGGKDGAIPKEFWNTSVNLQWHDVRNEATSCRRHEPDRHGMGAQGLKMQELSSEVFGSERKMQASTVAPRKELLADTADHMRVDSSLDVNSQPCHAPLSHSHAYGTQQGPQGPKKHAQHRFAENLNHSNGFVLGDAEEGQPQQQPQVRASQDRVRDEDPSNMHRRRKEKNFSDLFGAKSGEYANTRGKREEVTGSKTCSFLDTRSEIATRNKDSWKAGPAAHAADRKEAHLSSGLFDHVCPDKPDMEPAHREVHGNERACWDTRDLLQSGSEIARRRRHMDHEHHTDAHTALMRKQEDMASTQIRVGLNQGKHDKPFHTMKHEITKQEYGRMEQPVTAKDTKLASLQSSIFS